jgi:hypothetical protein
MAMVAKCIGIGCVEEQEDDFSMAMVTADSKLHAEERHVQEPTTAMVADCTGLGRVEEQEDDSSVATVIGDSRLHAEKRHVKEMQKEKQSELQKKIVGDAAGAWQNFCAGHAGQNGRLETSLMMDGQSREEIREQILQFTTLCIEESEMSGKVLESTIKALALFFTVFRFDTAWVFQDPQVMTVVKREWTMTFDEQKDAARRAYNTQTKAMSVRQVLVIVQALFDEQRGRSEENLRMTATCLATACVINWGWRFGAACGPVMKELRAHGVHPDDVCVLFTNEEAALDEKAAVIMYKSHVVADMESALAAGYQVVDMIICLPSSKAVRKKAVKIPPARNYSVGHGTEEQTQMLRMLLHYVRAAGLQNTPERVDSFNPAERWMEDRRRPHYPHEER